MQLDKYRTVACIAPHPDDETLGCGGALLRHIQNGDSVHWIVVTEINAAIGFSQDRVLSRASEIQNVAAVYGFSGVHCLGFPTMRLDQLPLLDVIGAIGNVIKSISAEIIYLPFRNDAHTDHAVVFDAGISCAKSFRYPSVKSVLAYETLSETEFGLKPEDTGFRPNVFINIEKYLERKIEIMRMYEGEMAPFPFPRSEIAIRALSQLRGSQCGQMAAESFMLLKEIR